MKIKFTIHIDDEIEVDQDDWDEYVSMHESPNDLAIAEVVESFHQNIGESDVTIRELVACQQQ